ncbi:MAG: HlyD family efflux transporter periplasmic adaptor subunit [Eubacteriales bacterium]|nr:HlyD family efflux transporter periplasmic adaptor subunit [Eubacteriales bacterium]
MSQLPVKKKKHKKWPWIVAAIAIIILVVILTGVNSVSAALKEAVVTRRDLTTYYSFSGNLTPVYDEVQTAKEALKVKELYVAEGDGVKEGDLLLRGVDGARIYAAHDGTIETLYPELNDQLQPGAQVARIVDYDQLEVSVDVDEYDVDAITLGKEGTVYLNALDRQIPGTVTEIARSATVDGGVSYFKVKIRIDAQAQARSGMSVEVTILNQQALGVTTLPLSAISYDEYNKPYVLKKDEKGKTQSVSITTGVSDGQNVEITAGVEDGETVYYLSNDMARFYAMRESMLSQSAGR